MTIGEKIRNIRKQNGQKLSVVAENSGISTPYLSELERDLKDPSVKALECICHALSISLSDFFAEDTPEPAVNPKLLRKLEEMPAEKQEKLIKFIEDWS